MAQRSVEKIVHTDRTGTRRAAKSPGVEPQNLPGDCAPFLKHLLSGGGLPEICG